MTLLTKKKKKKEKASWKKGNHMNYKEKLGEKNTVESLAPFEINDITTLYLTNT